MQSPGPHSPQVSQERTVYTRQLQRQQKKREESLGHFCKKRWPVKAADSCFQSATGMEGQEQQLELLFHFSGQCWTMLLVHHEPLTLCYLLISTCTCEFFLVPEGASKLFHSSPCALPVKRNTVFSLQLRYLKSMILIQQSTELSENACYRYWQNLTRARKYFFVFQAAKPYIKYIGWKLNKAEWNRKKDLKLLGCICENRHIDFW